MNKLVSTHFQEQFQWNNWVLSTVRPDEKRSETERTRSTHFVHVLLLYGVSIHLVGVLLFGFLFESITKRRAIIDAWFPSTSRLTVESANKNRACTRSFVGTNSLIGKFHSYEGMWLPAGLARTASDTRRCSRNKLETRKLFRDIENKREREKETRFPSWFFNVLFIYLFIYFHFSRLSVGCRLPFSVFIEGTDTVTHRDNHTPLRIYIYVYVYNL